MSNQEINKDSVQKFLDSLENTLGTRKIDENCDTTKIIRFQAGDTKYKKAFHYEYNLKTKKLGFYVEYKKWESEIFEKLVNYITFCFVERKCFLNNLPAEEISDMETVQKKWTINENIETLEKFKERLNDLISIFEPILCGLKFVDLEKNELLQKSLLRQYEIEKRLQSLESNLLLNKISNFLQTHLQISCILKSLIFVIPLFASIMFSINCYKKCRCRESYSKDVLVNRTSTDGSPVDDKKFTGDNEKETVEVKSVGNSPSIISSTITVIAEYENNTAKETDESSDSTSGGDK